MTTKKSIAEKKRRSEVISFGDIHRHSLTSVVSSDN
jgi:hypothetical protein